MKQDTVTASAKRFLLAGALIFVSSSPWIEMATAAQPCGKAAEQQGPTDDRRTTEEIRRRIADDESVSPLARLVTVTTSDGVVTLRGPVGSDEERLVLASLAESAPGVRRVDDRLELGP
jgi:osmotically-inducible protein OsmY